jgi:hypothetical protein
VREIRTLGLMRRGLEPGPRWRYWGTPTRKRGATDRRNLKAPRQSSTLLGDERAERPTRLRVWRGESPRAVNCLFRTASISGACGGNKA